MHPGPVSQEPKALISMPENIEKKDKTATNVSSIDCHCTEVCGETQAPKSCAKICLVRLFPVGQREKAVKMYAVIDDQSNRSLARSEFFELFNVEDQPYQYSLRTCSGLADMSGRRAVGFCIEANSEGKSFALPPLLECNQIPNNRSEIPTPNVALYYPHLKSVAKHIPDIDSKAEILLLLRRDIIQVHKVRQKINGPSDAPFAQKLDLGWVLVGDVCLQGAHKPNVRSFKTSVLQNGRTSYLASCGSFIKLKETVCHGGEKQEIHSCHHGAEHNIGSAVFNQTVNDNKLAPSFEDTAFLKIMAAEMYRDEANSWVAPLPFREPRQQLPNNREQAVSRLASLCRTLNRKPEMKDQFVTFMGKMFENDHAEPASPLTKNEECWYLPFFGVYHPQKPGQIRVFFDSSARHQDMSLNSALLVGPDLNNSLLGVLIQFRKEKVAFTADIKQMFHCFLVREDHRNFLRFLWLRDNDLTKDIIEYRMKVHVFGNRPSPAIAIYGLRRAAEACEGEYGTDTHKFIQRHFYVDDALMSLTSD
ncbi:hypothetical protein NFI96_006642 [Prochilodus magdalenae]|nr:hypothetical protein NFI96_006642 [Prochilodus magdalenae]